MRRYAWFNFFPHLTTHGTLFFLYLGGDVFLFSFGGFSITPSWSISSVFPRFIFRFCELLHYWPVVVQDFYYWLLGLRLSSLQYTIFIILIFCWHFNPLLLFIYYVLEKAFFSLTSPTYRIYTDSLLFVNSLIKKKKKSAYSVKEEHDSKQLHSKNWILVTYSPTYIRCSSRSSTQIHTVSTLSRVSHGSFWFQR